MQREVRSYVIFMVGLVLGGCGGGGGSGTDGATAPPEDTPPWNSNSKLSRQGLTPRLSWRRRREERTSTSSSSQDAFGNW